MKKLQTIDESCGEPKGSFKKFIQKKEKHLIAIEAERKRRIAKSRQKYIYVTAVICPNCKDIIYSRAGHDFHYCSCNDTAVDGGFNYLRLTYKDSAPKIKKIRVYATRQQLYEDWNYRKDKFGRISAK